jgi:hypothetical protein
MVVKHFYFITKYSHITGEVSSVEVKGDIILAPKGIAIYHKDQSLFVACDQTVMKVTPSGCIY